jgi:hypothetical protein
MVRVSVETGVVLPVPFRGVFGVFPQQNLQKKDLFSTKEANFATNEFKFEQKIELGGLFLHRASSLTVKNSRNQCK